MKKPSKDDKAQISPLAHTNIEQLVDHLAHLSEDAEAQLAKQPTGVSPLSAKHSQGSEPSQDSQEPKSTLQGWQLASGIELLCWKAILPQPMEFQRTAEPDDPVWSILLTDSTNLVASTEQKVEPQNGPFSQGASGMIYLYNHHLPLDVLLEGPGQVQLLLIRLKPSAWQHILQKPPSHVQDFIDDTRPRFHGFDLQGTCGEYFYQLLKDNLEINAPWQRLQWALGICNQVFSQLGSRQVINNAFSLRPRDSQRIHKVRQLLLSDFQNPLSLSEIGKSVGLGRDKLRQLFQQVYGTTPNKYYQHQRMIEARRLILEENFSAMDAGFQVGYSHLGHFAQAFKKQFGCLPKNCKKESN
jgi:AraC-like DNA-binding protein